MFSVLCPCSCPVGRAAESNEEEWQAGDVEKQEEGDPQDMEREQSAARSALKSAARHRGPEALEVLRLALARARAAGLGDAECWAVLDLLGNLAVPGDWEEAPSGDARSAAWRPLPAACGRAADQGLYIYQASGKGRRLTIGEERTVDFQLMTCSKQRSSNGNTLIVPVRRKDSVTSEQTHPEPDAKHPWFARKVTLRELEGDWLTNEFFWTAFKKCLSDDGEMIDVNAEELFDFQYNFDYRNWTGAEEEVRGGVKYKIPKGWKRFACRVKNKFGQDDAYWVVNDPADIRPYGVLVKMAER